MAVRPIPAELSGLSVTFKELRDNLLAANQSGEPWTIQRAEMKVMSAALEAIIHAFEGTVGALMEMDARIQALEAKDMVRPAGP